VPDEPVFYAYLAVGETLRSAPPCTGLMEAAIAESQPHIDQFPLTAEIHNFAEGYLRNENESWLDARPAAPPRLLISTRRSWRVLVFGCSGRRRRAGASRAERQGRRGGMACGPDRDPPVRDGEITGAPGANHPRGRRAIEAQRLIDRGAGDAAPIAALLHQTVEQNPKALPSKSPGKLPDIFGLFAILVSRPQPVEFRLPRPDKSA
jgi:hypothetical protein